MLTLSRSSSSFSQSGRFSAFTATSAAYRCEPLSLPLVCLASFFLSLADTICGRIRWGTLQHSDAKEIPESVFAATRFKSKIGCPSRC